MEIIPKTIFVSAFGLHRVSNDINEAKEEIDVSYKEMVDSNDFFISTLNGDIKNYFSRAVDVTEESVATANRALLCLVNDIREFAEAIKEIDLFAKEQAEGEKDE